MRLLNELADYPLMKQVRGSASTDDEQVFPPLYLALSVQISCACATQDLGLAGWQQGTLRSIDTRLVSHLQQMAGPCPLLHVWTTC